MLQFSVKTTHFSHLGIITDLLSYSFASETRSCTSSPHSVRLTVCTTRTCADASHTLKILLFFIFDLFVFNSKVLTMHPLFLKLTVPQKFWPWAGGASGRWTSSPCWEGVGTGRGNGERGKAGPLPCSLRAAASRPVLSPPPTPACPPPLPSLSPPHCLVLDCLLISGCI